MLSAGIASVRAGGSPFPSYAVQAVPCPATLDYCNIGPPNQEGVVLGAGYPASIPSEDSPPPQGFIYTGGRSAALPVPAGYAAFVGDEVTGHGLIAGSAITDSNNFNFYPYTLLETRWGANWHMLLNPLGRFRRGQVADANSTGTIAGSVGEGYQSIPVVWEKASVRATALPLYPPYNNGSPVTIDGAGDVIGYEYCMDRGTQCANAGFVLWPNGGRPIRLHGPKPVGSLTGVARSPTGKIYVTGSYTYNPVASQQEGCLWTITPATPGQPIHIAFHEMHFLPGQTESIANDVNSHGVVVGTSGAPTDATTTAFLWKPGYGPTLYSLAPLADGNGINDRGQITGDNELLTPSSMAGPRGTRTAPKIFSMPSTKGRPAKADFHAAVTGLRTRPVGLASVDPKLHFRRAPAFVPSPSRPSVRRHPEVQARIQYRQ